MKVYMARDGDWYQILDTASTTSAIPCLVKPPPLKQNSEIDTHNSARYFVTPYHAPTTR